jgi:hypothetical protein
MQNRSLNKIESEGEIDESEHSQSSEMETESEDEHIENTEVIYHNFLIMRICTWAFPCYYR